MNRSSVIVYHMPMSLRTFPVVIGLTLITQLSSAQQDTLTPAPWLHREFHYWSGVPPMHVHEPTDHGDMDTEVMGYTDEERRMSFFRDHRYQEVIFEDQGFTALRIWQPGDCEPLRGDTVAVLTGTWSWANDTLHVTVERTAQYPLEDVLEQYMKRDMDKPFAMPMPPASVCNTERDRLFWFEGEHLSEAVRRWD